MRYDPTDRSLIFSTEMLDRVGVEQGYVQQAQEDTRRRKVDKIVIIVGAIILFGGFPLALFSVAATYALYGAALIALAVLLYVRGRSHPDKKGSIAGSVMMMLLGLANILPLLLAPLYGADNCIVISTGLWFLLGGLFMILHQTDVFVRSRPKAGTEIVAECIGYVFRTHQKNAGHHHRTVVRLAEVFEYRIDGVVYQAYNGIFHRNPAARVGEYVNVRVREQNPWDVWYTTANLKVMTPGSLVFGLLFALIPLALGSAIIYPVVTHKIDKEGHVVQESSEEEKILLTDLTLASELGDDVQYDLELRNISNAYGVDGQFFFTFTDGITWEVPEEIFQQVWTDEDLILVLEPGTHNILRMYRTSEWEYKGSHTVTDCRSSVRTGR